MPEYRRFISYIYAYDRGIKNKNVGFAKIEVRNGECRITINIKGAFAASGKNLETYLFHRNQEKMLGTQIGSFPVKNGAGEIHVVTAADNICTSGFTLEQMNGIVLCHMEDAANMYASGWDDHAMLLENFSPMDSVWQKELAAAEVMPVMEAVEEELERLRACAEPTESETETGKPEQRLEAQISETSAGMMEPEGLLEESRQRPQKQLKQEHSDPDVDRVHNGLWSRLESTFPKVVAFEDEPGILCLKIDLKDLEYLPRENWGLANNSFLLHGYYNFRYLILGELEENQYMIGVPGMFHNNERFMAAMFGFEHFKPVKDYRPLTGHFGYWYQWIAM